MGHHLHFQKDTITFLSLVPHTCRLVQVKNRNEPSWTGTNPVQPVLIYHLRGKENSCKQNQKFKKSKSKRNNATFHYTTNKAHLTKQSIKKMNNINYATASHFSWFPTSSKICQKLSLQNQFISSKANHQHLDKFIMNTNTTIPWPLLLLLPIVLPVASMVITPLPLTVKGYQLFSLLKSKGFFVLLTWSKRMSLVSPISVSLL